MDMKKVSIFLCLTAILAAPMTAQAQAKVDDSKNWHLETGRIIGGSSQDSGVRLMDPVLLDFDADGFPDIIFGAPGAAPNGITSAGSVYVIKGSKDMTFDGKLDVTNWNSFDYRIDGHTTNGMLGINLMTGDFNGDGIKDLAIAEPGMKGAVYILYGGKKREPGIYDITQKGASDVAFVTPENGSSLGLSACVGDFNRDGIDDLALSYLTHSSSLGSNISQVAVMTMRREWDKATYDITSKIYGKTLLSRPISSTSRVLHTCAVGDFNDDNVTDIALGMPLDAYQKQKASGSVTIIYHPYKYNGTVVDLANLDEKVGIRINGNQTNAQFGYSLAAGDFTGDGRDDLAISAPNRLVKGPENEGAVYIYDANAWPKETCEQPETMQITGKGGQFGYRLQATDVNGDKRPDLVVSAPTAGKTPDGALSVWLGGPHFVESMESDTKADIELLGSDFMGFGLGSAFGDINQDGKFDAVIRTSADPLQRQATGAYTVIGDFQNLPQSSILSENFKTIQAPSKGGGISTQGKIVEYQDHTYRAWFSPKGMGNRSVICLTDINRSMDSDISVASSENCDVQIVGPENYEISDFTFSKSPTLEPLLTLAVPNMHIKKSNGFVAVIPLPEQITQPLVLNLNENTLKTEAQTYILSGEENASLGYKLEWKDLDGDGYEDLLIGAPRRKVDQEILGTIFIVKGSATTNAGFHELTASNVIQLEGFSDEEFGSQWTVIDFNANGKLDLLARAAHTPDAQGDEYATVYAIYDVGDRVPKSYGVRAPELGSMRIIAPQNRSGLEIIPQNIDLNDDGFDDLMLISPYYRAGLQKQGIVYVLTSNPDNKSGELHLTSESHIAFSFTPGRNEKLVDARFMRVNGVLQFVSASADLTTGLTTMINAFVEKKNEPYQGKYTESQLTRVRSEARLPKPARLMMNQDSQKVMDELWIVFPYDGITQSGQGIVQKVKI